MKDLIRVPLLHYAAKFWYAHFQDGRDNIPELRFLQEPEAVNCWLQVHNLHKLKMRPFEDGPYLALGS